MQEKSHFGDHFCSFWTNKKSNPEGLLSPILTSWAGDDMYVVANLSYFF